MYSKVEAICCVFDTPSMYPGVSTIHMFLSRTVSEPLFFFSNEFPISLFDHQAGYALELAKTSTIRACELALKLPFLVLLLSVRLGCIGLEEVGSTCTISSHV